MLRNLNWSYGIYDRWKYCFVSTFCRINFRFPHRLWNGGSGSVTRARPFSSNWMEKPKIDIPILRRGYKTLRLSNGKIGLKVRYLNFNHSYLLPRKTFYWQLFRTKNRFIKIGDSKIPLKVAILIHKTYYIDGRPCFH